MVVLYSGLYIKWIHWIGMVLTIDICIVLFLILLQPTPHSETKQVLVQTPNGFWMNNPNLDSHEENPYILSRQPFDLTI